jgi:hypothetical protein
LVHDFFTFKEHQIEAIAHHDSNIFIVNYIRTYRRRITSCPKGIDEENEKTPRSSILILFDFFQRPDQWKKEKKNSNDLLSKNLAIIKIIWSIQRQRLFIFF